MNLIKTAWISCLLVACSGNDDPGSTVAAGSEPTWHQDVAPIFSENCSQCHAPDGVAAFLDLTDYAAATPWAPAIESAVSSGRMPPFLALPTDVCENSHGFQHDARLDDSEVDTIVAWVAGGALEGDASAAAPLPSPLRGELERVDEELVPLNGYTTQSSAVITDELICYVLDPQQDQTRWIEGLQVVPDNVAVVHHALINLASRDAAAAADAADGSTDGWYDCLGGVNVPGARLVGGWIPGGGPTEYPSGTGVEMGVDEVMVVQMHYHTLVDPQTDQTSVQVQWAPSEPEDVALVQLWGNARNASQGLLPGPNDAADADFLIPAGATGHTETSRHDLPIPEGIDVDVFMVAPHMHYVGVDLRAWIEHADGTPGDCLVHVPAWDFDWQLLYFYDAAAGRAPTVRAGDKLVIECTYDNSLDNPAVVSALEQSGLTAPTDVRIGEGSLDEMCLLGVGTVLRD